MVSVLDTTLREGEQTPGVYFDPHIKEAIARLLDEIGIDFIEAGHPAVSQQIGQAVERIANIGLKAQVGAHSRSLIRDVDQALDCGVSFLGIFYCVSDNRLNNVFRKDLGSAVEQICEAISYARQKNPDLVIRYTPEDTVRSEFDNVVKASVAAVNAGADIISIADTTGRMIPGTENNFYHYVSALRAAFRQHQVNPRIAVHCHNDRGLALANALNAYEAGADIIDASVLGLGERAGIVDLAQLLTVLSADFGENRWNLLPLKELYRLVSKYCHFQVPANYPIMGQNAFTHCAGVHTHAAKQNPLHYESLNPELLGRQRRHSLDHMSGIASVKYSLAQLGESQDLAPEVLAKIKAVGQAGRVVEEEELIQIINSCK